MNMILLRKARFFFLYHGRKWSVRNSTYFAEVIFTPSGTLKGPTSSLPMIPAQNMTPATSLLTSQPCWDMVAIHQPSTTPSIWTIKGCTALIRKQNSLKVSLHVVLSPLQPFLLVSLV